MSTRKRDIVINAFRRFFQQRGTTLAAASSFYFLLTVVPTALLLVRAIGLIFGDLSAALDQVFIVAQNFFPNLAGGFLITIRELVQTALFGSVNITIVNFIFLIIGSLSFVNSLWTGVYLITEDRTYLSWRNYLRGLSLLGFSSLFVFLILMIPVLTLWFINFLKTNSFILTIYEAIDLPRQLLLDITLLDFDSNFLIKSDYFALTLFVLYFTYAFRQIFESNLSWKHALISAVTFSSGVFILKKVFWLYLQTLKESLLSNYGKAYTLVLGALWIYLLMCFFFFVVALGNELTSRRRALVAHSTKGYHGDGLEGELN